MLTLTLLNVFFFILIPTSAFAWGPLTHIYLANELFTLSPLLPVCIYEVIRRYKKDFLYGNIMADIIIGKKYLPENKNCHNWDFGFELLNVSKTDQQKSFVYGYMSHLAADTVAHNFYTYHMKNIKHTLLEIKADSIIDKKYWYQAISLDRNIQLRNDTFLSNSIGSPLFSFKTNKRILKSMVFLTIFYREKINDFVDKNINAALPDKLIIERYQNESLNKIIDLFQNWQESDVIKVNPNGSEYRVFSKSISYRELKSINILNYKKGWKRYLE
jgi:hypothetical protein